ncbi:hypothetical protein NL108_011342 [Boleophthalmus pectinirostris]|nr:hypothetical protein NL108_011342 [Boleophthalmus pectinirostris]
MHVQHQILQIELVDGHIFIKHFSTFMALEALYVKETLTHSYTNVRRHWGRDGLSVLPKDTTAAFICGSWNHTSHTVGQWIAVDCSTNDVYVKSEIRMANFHISGYTLYQLGYCLPVQASCDVMHQYRKCSVVFLNSIHLH